MKLTLVRTGLGWGEAKPIHTVVGMLQLLKVNTCNTGMKLQVTEVYGTARAQKEQLLKGGEHQSRQYSD